MIQIVTDLKDSNAITHAGSFHADDIFSTIFLSKFQDIYLYRAQELDPNEDYSSKIVFDIGYGEFDHHGINARIRDNGLKYSAFGLLFERFGREYIKAKGIADVEECYSMFLHEFILQIDAIDNGVFPSNPKNYSITSLSMLIELFNRTWKEEKSTNEAFQEGLTIGELIFNRIEKRIFDKMAAKALVEKSIQESQDQILILKEYMPFTDFLLNSQEEKAQNILYAIFPSNRGGYNIRAIPKENGSAQTRKPFPKSWGGKSKEELFQLTNIPTFHFCHVNLFLCSCDTLEDALLIAKLAIKK